jgi:hypothetical protein
MADMMTARQFNIQVSRTMSESVWQAHVIKAARLFGWMIYHTYDSRRNQAGFPDLVLVRPPRVLFVELKSQGGRIRDEQIEWLTALEASTSVETYLWRPSAREQMLEVLR